MPRVARARAATAWRDATARRSKRGAALLRVALEVSLDHAPDVVVAALEVRRDRALVLAVVGRHRRDRAGRGACSSARAMNSRSWQTGRLGSHGPAARTTEAGKSSDWMRTRKWPSTASAGDPALEARRHGPDRPQLLVAEDRAPVGDHVVVVADQARQPCRAAGLVHVVCVHEADQPAARRLDSGVARRGGPAVWRPAPVAAPGRRHPRAARRAARGCRRPPRSARARSRAGRGRCRTACEQPVAARAPHRHDEAHEWRAHDAEILSSRRDSSISSAAPVPGTGAGSRRRPAAGATPPARPAGGASGAGSCGRPSAPATKTISPPASLMRKHQSASSQPRKTRSSKGPATRASAVRKSWHAPEHVEDGPGGRRGRSPSSGAG